MAHIAIIEDEAAIAAALRRLLERNGHRVSEAADGRAGVRLVFEGHPDLVLLDVGLPVLDGWQTLERIRDLTDTPVLMLTGRGLESEKVRGLVGGADDYLTKPWGNPELLARVEALLRRSRGGTHAASERFEDGELVIDVEDYRVRQRGHDVEISPLEFRLLTALARAAGRTLTHEQLLEQAWRDPFAGSHAQVKSAVRHLRRRLGWDEEGPIRAVRGVGYRYVAGLPDAGGRSAGRADVAA